MTVLKLRSGGKRLTFTVRPAEDFDRYSWTVCRADGSVESCGFFFRSLDAAIKNAASFFDDLPLWYCEG